MTATGTPDTATTAPALNPGAGTATGDVTGTWTVTTGSQAGYRVQEILFGQKAEAVGRTEVVTGQIQFELTEPIALPSRWASCPPEAKMSRSRPSAT